MSAQKNKRRASDDQAYAKLKSLRVSPQKLNLIAGMIRGKSAAKALTDLQFSRKKAAKDVQSLLQSAVANAENNHGLDIDRLFVKEVNVGKSMVMKRYQPRARGRASRIQKPFSNISIKLEERADS
jgi:large subunit ribosomal protein L22